LANRIYIGAALPPRCLSRFEFRFRFLSYLPLIINCSCSESSPINIDIIIMVCTEVVSFTLKGDRDPAAAALQELIRSYLAGSAGLKSLVEGHQLEDPRKIQWYLNWESLEAHKALMGSDTYAGFVEKILAVADVNWMLHSTFVDEERVKIFEKAPVIETVRLVLKDDTDKAEYRKALDTTEEILARTGKDKGLYGLTGAATHEKDSDILLIIGWESMEAHIAWKESCTELEPAMQPFRAGVESVELFHIKVTNRYSW